MILSTTHTTIDAGVARGCNDNDKTGTVVEVEAGEDPTTPGTTQVGDIAVCDM